MKNILILGQGGMAGAFGAGFVYELTRRGKLEIFDEIYCFSVGVYAGTYGVAGQSEELKKIWLENVNGFKLINPFNLLSFGIRKPLKLEYLEWVFSSTENKLNIEKVFRSKVKIKYAVMDFFTGEVLFLNPTKEKILKQMSASSAVPVVHGSVRIDKERYLDASFIYGDVPFLNKIVEKGDKITYIRNFPENYQFYSNSKLNSFLSKKVFNFISEFYTHPVKSIFKKRFDFIKINKKYIYSEKRLQLIFPKTFHLKSSRDTNKERIKKLFEEGTKEASEFISYFTPEAL